MSIDAVLNSKQARFVREYLVDGNGTRAAVAAGYGRAGARVAAHRLITNANVREALQTRQHADATRLSIHREDVIQGLLLAIEQAKAQGNPAVMISGWREVGRMLNLYAPERITMDVTVDDSSMLQRMQAMSDAELLAIIVSGG